MRGFDPTLAAETRPDTTRSPLAFLQDQCNQALRRISLSTSVVTTVAGTAGVTGSADGVGIAALFNSPSGITMDTAGTVVLVVRDPDLPVLQDTRPHLALDSHYTPYNFVFFYANNVIRRVILATGVVTTIAGLAGSTGALDGVGSISRFNLPVGIGMDAAGTIALIVSGRGSRGMTKAWPFFFEVPPSAPPPQNKIGRLAQ